MLGGVVLLVFAVVVGAIVAAGSSGTADQQELTVASQQLIPNAEPFGSAWGPTDAPIKIEEFVDYQCPACGAYAREIEPEVVAAFAATGKVRYEVHNFQFKGAASQNAAEGAYCAAKQDRFWPMHTSIFLNQPQDHGASGVYNDAQLIAIAGRLGMDTAAFRQCLSGDTYVPRVQADYERATTLNIQSTPTFLVNGQPFVGIQRVEDFRRIFATIAPNVKVTP